MKFNNPTLAVPYIGLDEAGNTTRNWANFRFAGQVDRRRIKRMVRKWVKRNLGRRIHTSELHSVCRTVRIKTQ